jgi:hypothetical protein
MTTDLLELEHRLRTEIDTVASWNRADRGTSTGKNQYVGRTESGLLVLRKVASPDRSVNFYEAPHLARNEEAAYLIAKTGGFDDLMTPCICRRTTVSEYGFVVEASFQIICDGHQPKAASVINERDGLRALAFDIVIRNMDRRLANMLIRPDGKLLLIDHSRSFQKWSQFPFEKALHHRFATKAIPDDVLDGLNEIRRCLPDRVYELLDDANVMARLRRRTTELIACGQLSANLLD